MSQVTPFLLFVLFSQSHGESQWSSNPNGQLRPIRNVAGVNCGTCPAGTQREPTAYGACGRCIPEDRSCAPGYVLMGNKCSPCPCPGTNTDRKFGTACRVDVDGQITCDCTDGYSGRDCSQCAPGAVQSNQYPYNCVRVNQNNTQSTYCPPGNYCPNTPVNQIVANPPIQPPQITCSSNNCYPTQPCQIAQPPPPPPPSPWPQPPILPPIPPQPCPVSIPGPGPILCPNQPTVVGPCQTQCACTTQCATTNLPCPVQPQPQLQCPPSVNCPQPQCPPAVNCPIGPINCPPIQPPVIQPSPTTCIYPQPQPQPQPQPCPTCPAVNCPSPCPSPCPQIPPQQPCNNVQCPNPCQPCPPGGNCPMCPSCPSCPQQPPCYNCPNPCPPCPPGGNCPPCQQCGDCPRCPDCKLNVTCPGVGEKQHLPCICDPRGTISQYGETCFCKNNVEGQRCNTCKPGYFALSEDRSQGCLECWGSGVSTYCTAAVFYRSWISVTGYSNCSLELTVENSTTVYNRDSNNRFSWDGREARLSLMVSTRLYWSLPACFKGNRLTSYGALLRFSRMFTGSGSNLGPDNDVIIVGGNGARLYFSSFKNQSNGVWEKLDVLLDETTHMIFYKNDNSRIATRFDILEVLADVHMILIRATFTSTTMSTSIRDVDLGTVSKSYTQQGFVLVIEQARCPTGYTGLSCESCAVGYFRDSSDMTASVFGACKYCPCGRNSIGCHVSYGVVYCKCKFGFTGDRCQDKEVITVTLDPFWVRDCEGTEIDFTCTFTTNSKNRTLLMRLGLESDRGSIAEQVTSVSQTYSLTNPMGRIKCEIVDRSGMVWAQVYAAIQIEPCSVAVISPPKTITIITEDFICVEEGEEVVMKAMVYFYGSITVRPEWFKLGEISPRYNGPEYTIHRARAADSGTYLVSALQGDTMDVKHITLIVRPDPNSKYSNDDPSVLMIDQDQSDDNRTYIFNKSAPALQSIQLKQKTIITPLTKRPLSPLLNSMQKDQAIDGYPSVIVEPTEIRAKIGETVTLHCNASGEEPMKFYWKSGTSDYIPVHVRVSRGALIFKSVKKEDEGAYYCVAWNNLGQVTAKANIIVDGTIQSKPIPPLTLFVSKIHNDVPEGLNAYFNCSTNNPNIKPMWSRKDGELPKNSDVTKNGTLIIYKVRGTDAGIYVCKAKGPGGNQVEVEATLGFIPAAPFRIPTVMLNPKSPVKARSGEQVKIECIATGYPSPIVTWSRSLDGLEKVLVSNNQTDGNATFYEISHVTKDESGKYLCTAINQVGSASESLSLLIDDAILCKTNEFRCKSGDQCVPKEDRCDNERDCKDGSDEHHCRKRSRRQAPELS